jgi:hypothetical protein
LEGAVSFGEVAISMSEFAVSFGEVAISSGFAVSFGEVAILSLRLSFHPLGRVIHV